MNTVQRPGFALLRRCDTCTQREHYVDNLLDCVHLPFV